MSLCRLVILRSCKFVLIPSVFLLPFLCQSLFLCDWSIKDRCWLLLIYFYIGFLCADMYNRFFSIIVFTCVWWEGLKYFTVLRSNHSHCFVFLLWGHLLTLTGTYLAAVNYSSAAIPTLALDFAFEHRLFAHATTHTCMKYLLYACVS